MPGTLPVLFFGDLPTADLATVGLNPSDREYTTRTGELLSGPAQRFATLESLGATSRDRLTEDQCDRAIERMRGYFGPEAPVYGWFRGLGRVVEGLSSSFTAGRAAHLDLVQEATRPTWSRLEERERDALLGADLDFLEWQIRTFPLRVICTGARVGRHVRERLGVTETGGGERARVRWWVGEADVDGRRVAVGGWNIPLARPTGLGASGETELGRLRAAHLPT